MLKKNVFLKKMSLPCFLWQSNPSKNIFETIFCVLNFEFENGRKKYGKWIRRFKGGKIAVSGVAGKWTTF